MAKIYIEPSGVRRLITDEESLASKLRDLSQDVENIRSSMDYEIAGKAAIYARLRESSQQIERESSGVSNVRSCLEQVLSLYEQTEGKNLGQTQSAPSGSGTANTTQPGNILSDLLNKVLKDLNGGQWMIPPGTHPPVVGPTTSLLNLIFTKAKEAGFFKTEGSIKGKDEPLDQKVSADLVKAGKDRDGIWKEIDDFEDKHSEDVGKQVKYYKDLKTGKVIPVTDDNEDEFKKHNKGTIPVDVKLMGVGGEGSFALYELDGEYKGKYGGAEGSVSFVKTEGNYGAYIGMLGVGAEAGVSLTAFSAEEKAYLGTDNLQVYEKVQVEAGKLEAKAGVNAGLVDKEGNFNPSLYGGVSAEAIAGEVSGSVGVKALGADVAVKGSLNYGVGAHANVGFHDGKLSVDVGATLGVGVGVKLDIDVSGTVKAVHETVQNVWSGVKGFFGR